MKLVTVTTGEVVAVYANVSISVKKRGMMRFLMGEKNETDLGFEFQLMVVMSVFVDFGG